MAIAPATRAQLPLIERLLRGGRFVWVGMAAEDLPGLVARGMVLLAGDAAHPWGVLVVHPEERPTTLPSHAPDRAELRAVALRHGPWLADAGAAFGVALHEAAQRHGRPLEISAYATEGWLQRLLAEAGFAHRDDVIFLHCLLAGHAAGQSLPVPLPAMQLRAAELDDIPALAALDAETFDPLWHFGRTALMELLLRGRLQLLEGADGPIGYASLLPSKARELHLARLAVHPAQQGRGAGRLLLADALCAARAQGAERLALNTQRSNLRSQRLYHAAGFVPSGVELPVYLRRLG